MKRFIVFLILCMPLLSMQGTKSWVYVNPQSVSNLQPYDDALGKADLDRYRYFDRRNTLHFESGLDVQLLSANEMIDAGMPVRTERVRTQEPEFDTKPVFRLAPNGVIIEMQTRTKAK